MAVTLHHPRGLSHRARVPAAAARPHHIGRYSSDASPDSASAARAAAARLAVEGARP